MSIPNRYYWQRNRTTGVYQIKDRFLASESVASCNYREQATLVTDALNHLHHHKQSAEVTIDVKSNPASINPTPLRVNDSGRLEFDK